MRTSPRGPLALATAVLAVAAAVTGCGSGSSTTDRRAPDEGFSATAALRDLPPGERATVVAGDLDRASTALGVDRPDASASDDRVSRWQIAMSRNAYVPRPAAFAEAMGPRARLGFDLRDVRWFAANEVPPRQTTVLHTFDGTRINPDLPTRDGMILTGTGNVGDIAPPDAGTGGGASPFVYVAALKRDGDRILVAQNTDDVKAWTGTASLADDDALASVARVIDGREGVYGVLVAHAGPHPSATRTPGDTTSSGGVSAVGIAEAGTRDAPLERIVYRVDDPGGARDGLERAWREGEGRVTRVPISQLATVESVDVVDDCVVVTITPGRPGFAFQAFLRADLPMP